MGKFLAKNGSFIVGTRVNSQEEYIKRKSIAEMYNTEDLVGAILTMYPDDILLITDRVFERFDRDVRAIVKSNKHMVMKKEEIETVSGRLTAAILKYVNKDVNIIRNDVRTVIQKQNNWGIYDPSK